MKRSALSTRPNSAKLKKAIQKLTVPKPLQEIHALLNNQESSRSSKKNKTGKSVLFHGPKKSGKTTMAALLALQAGKELYKVDLSKLVSKYIGETEKNLSVLFQLAEDKGWILFFDEADALFGKRSEVKDSHDRYANFEVSYLNQKMEQHKGMIILASNLKSNLDPAFIRRMRFIVKFPFALKQVRG